MNREIEKLSPYQKNFLLKLIDLHKKNPEKQIIVYNIPFRSSKRYFMNKIKELMREGK